jgi:hypothetical protein
VVFLWVFVPLVGTAKAPLPLLEPVHLR